MTFDLLKDRLEPFYQDLDHIIDEVIRPALPKSQLRYFEACRFKIRAIWYIYCRIKELDRQYREFLSLCISENALNRLSLTGDGERYRYFPFYEALEFENLLSQGKACLDHFSKATGSMYSESPNNIDKLVNVLMSKPRCDKIDRILAFIKEVDRLSGVIIDPKSTEKKSVRNLISHRERIDIFFTITLDHNTGTYSTSYGALLNMRYPEVAKFPNYRVVDIAGKVWFLLMGIIENCFQVLFNDPPSR